MKTRSESLTGVCPASWLGAECKLQHECCVSVDHAACEKFICELHVSLLLPSEVSAAYATAKIAHISSRRWSSMFWAIELACHDSGVDCSIFCYCVFTVEI